MPHSTRERDAVLAGLDAEARALVRLLSANGFLSADALAARTGGARERIDPVLARLKSLGVVEDFPETPLRPFARLWRVAATRVAIVADLLTGGEADAGRGWTSLSDVQRDWPWVRSLDEPADGAAAEDDARRAARAAEDEARRISASTTADARTKEAALERKRAALALAREIAADLDRGKGWALDAEGLAAALADFETMDGVSPAFLDATRARIAVLGGAA